MNIEEATHLLGVNNLKAWQQRAIESSLNGENLFITQPTGAGKSAVYQVSAMMSPRTTIVVQPLVVLLDDQVSFLKSRGISARWLTKNDCENSKVENDSILKEAENLKMLFLSPEKLQLNEGVSICFMTISANDYFNLGS